MTPALIGIAAGAVAALAAGRLMEKLVFGVSASDPMTFAAVAATLVLVALLASLVPAYRASRLDPSEVLRARLVSRSRDRDKRPAARPGNMCESRGRGADPNSVRLQADRVGSG